MQTTVGSDSTATLSRLQFAWPARYILCFSLTSTPSEYAGEGVSEKLDVRPELYIAPTSLAASRLCQIKFSGAKMSEVKSSLFSALIFNKIGFAYTGIAVGTPVLKAGSILAEFTFAGDSEDTVNAALNKLHQMVSNGAFSVSYNNRTYVADSKM